MPVPDDEEFELYLKEFRPIVAEPVPTEARGRATWRWWVRAAWAGAAAAALIAGILVLHPLLPPALPPNVIESSGPEKLTNPQPLTLGRANALLATEPSFKAAVDKLAFEPESTPVAEGKYSALNVLGKEKVKL